MTGWAKTKGYLSYPGLGWIVLARRSVTQAFAPARVLQAKVLVGTGYRNAVCIAQLVDCTPHLVRND
ncbi:hypothetical protein [Acaryochloris marina]|uniref:hypothetical protein n=1 Tax=Acaryochloris marina TaxID=155978 RepID=UPI001BAE7800|nr:hypothetical protein [Acaryochloris marina]QUY45511.1 hypothetical protein I1H34_27485 [Acaryochloris marina S15]